MHKLLLCAFAVLVLTSCDRETNTYSSGHSWIDPESKIMMVDTMTLKMTTIMRDSVVTSGQKKILVGNVENSTFGKINSSSFMEMIPQKYSISGDGKPIFDSLVLFLTYDKYHYGDTLKTFHLSVFPTERRIKLNADGYLYNTSKLKYETSAVGKVAFRPSPNRDSAYVRIPIDHTYGQQIFNLLRTRDVLDQEYFLNFFKGLAIVAPSDNNAMLRFRLDPEYSIDPKKKNISTLMRMYYHTSSENGTEKTSQKFDINLSTQHQFNKITSDFSGSLLEGLTAKTPLSSSQLGNKSIMVSGIGVYTKIELPYLKKIQDIFTNYKVLYANLHASPAVGYYSKTFNNPNTAYYYLVDKTNTFLPHFRDTTKAEVSTSLSKNGEYASDYRYSFPLASYINTILVEKQNTNYSILMYPTKSSEPEINSLVIGDRKNSNNPTKAELFFISY